MYVHPIISWCLRRAKNFPFRIFQRQRDLIFYLMHFTISNSHIFNFSGTRLHGQGHSTNNFSSFTIHTVVYLLNKYLLRAPCYRRNFTRQTSSLSGRLPWDSELFVPCLHCGTAALGRRFLERLEDLATKFLPIHCSRAFLLAHKCLY